MRLKLTVILCLLAPNAFAQGEEIVVTGSRVVSRTVERPVVYMAKRADYVVQNATVECDTRSATARQSELRATLKTMIADAARNPQIDLSGRAVADPETEEEILIPLTEANYESFLKYAGRPDVSRVEIVIKTPVGKNEVNEQAALERIEAFEESVKVTGRSLIMVDDEFALSIVDPIQYRGEIIRRIAGDAKAISQGIGTGYDVQLSGLERQVYWRRSGQLDLALFIPYGLTVVPVE